ncbi:hypothetical protein [Streptomyces sp. NPDC126503]|uniref:hypothetical protein n=1 Tax=Streptomyces sp. NPDC126503 TaxID=3155315 RepID=UPI00331E7423
MTLLKDFGMPVLTAFLAWWLTRVTHKSTARAVARTTLESQAEALVSAVLQLRGSAAARRTLWDTPIETVRTILLASLAMAGGAANATLAGASQRMSGLVGFSSATAFLAEERRHTKTAAVSVIPQTAAVVAAAVPLLHHQDAAVVAGAQGILDAMSHIEDDARVGHAVRALNEAVQAAVQSRRRWWHRRTSS